jgi:4-hydroxy-tetrahydrodipicolinate reductase
MGGAIVSLVINSEAGGQVELFRVFDINEKLSGIVQGSDVEIYTYREGFFGECLPGADVIIDVSSPAGFSGRANMASSLKIPLVVGTTGLSEEDRACLRKAAEYIPCVLAANFSLGVNFLFWLVEQATAILGEGFDPEIMEIHHRRKKDSPSGTANRLAEIIAAVRGWDPKEVSRYGRQGIIGERPDGEIGIHSLRGGDVVGEHTVFFLGDGDRLELTSRITSRDAFAQGAVRAAKWVVGQKPGLYDMQDVLGLR